MDKFTQFQPLDDDLLSKLQPLPAQLSIDEYVALALLLIGAIGYLSYGKFWAKPDPYLYKLYERPQEQIGSNSHDEGARDVARQMLQHNKDLVIFWGSQSGTAEALAHRLGRDCSRRFGLNVLVADLSDYEPTSVSEISTTKFALFLVSTYGEGDPSDNTTDFLAWIQTRSHSLSNLRYAAFGLGNSNYVYYNKVVDELVQHLDALSAKSLLPVGKADDAKSGTDEDFASWRDDLFAMFQRTLGFEEHVPEYTPSIEVTEVSNSIGWQPNLGEPHPLKLSRRAARNYSPVKQLPIKDIRTITRPTSTGRSCLHFEVDLRNSAQIKYRTGDHLAVWPRNAADEVQRLIRVLGLLGKESTLITIAPANGETEVKIPRCSTISALFQHYLEISAPVSRDTVTALCQIAPTDTTRTFLQRLSTKSAFSAFMARNHITFARLLEHTLLQDATASWSNLPLAFVIESLKPMNPRYYSISSSSMTSPRQMAITVAISPSELTENPAITIPGLTTSYLSTLDISTRPSVYAHVRRSTFKMPFLHKTPIVLIAAGTGIAPFRGFLQERAQMANISNQEIGPVFLIFGCRHPDQDYLYKEEIEELQNGALEGKLEVVTAFSRLSEQPRCYVQDRLAEPAIKEKVVRMICEQEGHLYFCGSTTMAKTAGRVIVDSVKAYKGLDDAGAARWADGLKSPFLRWQEDVWG